MQLCSLLMTTFYGIKMFPLTTLADMTICARDARYILFPIQNLGNGYKLSLVFPQFSIVLLIVMNMQMRSFSFRHRSSINLTYDLIGSITKCHNNSMVLKVYLWIFKDFLSFSIKIHEYAN